MHRLSSVGQADCWYVCVGLRCPGDWVFVWSYGNVGHSCILADRCLSDSDGCWCYDSLHFLWLHCVVLKLREEKRREAGIYTDRRCKQIMMAALQLSLSAYPTIPCTVLSQLQSFPRLYLKPKAALLLRCPESQWLAMQLFFMKVFYLLRHNIGIILNSSKL